MKRDFDSALLGHKAIDTVALILLLAVARAGLPLLAHIKTSGTGQPAPIAIPAQAHSHRIHL